MPRNCQRGSNFERSCHWRVIGPRPVIGGTARGTSLIYVRAVSHDSIAAKGFSTRHSVWTSVNYGLQNHPDWKRKYAARYGNASGDSVWSNMFYDYLKRHPLPKGTSLFNERSLPRHDLWDNYLQLAFVEFVKHDPIFVTELYLYHNPYRIVSKIKGFLSALWRESSGWVMFALGVAITGMIAYLVRRADELRYHGELTATVGFGLAVAVLPSWFIVAILSSMVDPMFMALLVLIMVAVLAAALVLRPVYRLLIFRAD